MTRSSLKKSKPRPKAAGPKRRRKAKLLAPPYGFGIGGSSRYQRQEVSTLGGATPMRPAFNVRSSSRDSIHITGMETVNGGLFTIATNPTPEGYVVASIPLGPAAVASDRLATMSKLYTKYCFKSLKFHYVPSVSPANASAEGQILVAFERDPDQRYAAGSILSVPNYYAREGSVVGTVYSGWSAEYKLVDQQTTYYCDASSGEERWNYQGAVYLIAATDFLSVANYGKVWVEYEIVLTAPTTTRLVPSLSATFEGQGTAAQPFQTELSTVKYPWVSLTYLDSENRLTIQPGYEGYIILSSFFHLGDATLGTGANARYELDVISPADNAEVLRLDSRCRLMTSQPATVSGTNFQCGGFIAWWFYNTRRATAPFVLAFNNATSIPSESNVDSLCVVTADEEQVIVPTELGRVLTKRLLKQV